MPSWKSSMKPADLDRMGHVVAVADPAGLESSAIAVLKILKTEPALTPMSRGLKRVSASACPGRSDRNRVQDEDSILAVRCRHDDAAILLEVGDQRTSCTMCWIRMSIVERPPSAAQEIVEHALTPARPRRPHR